MSFDCSATPMKVGKRLRVYGIEDDLYGIIVAVRKGRKKYSVPLVD